MDPVSKAIEDLERNPKRFLATEGYERLVNLLRDGHAPDAVKRFLRGNSELVGDILWVVCELESVEPYVSEALLHISDSDKGTAAYAIEVVLRGSRSAAELRTLFERLRSSHAAVCAHAARVLAEQGVLRVIEVLRATGLAWAATMADNLSRGSLPDETVKDLLTDGGQERQVLGVALATLAIEKSASAMKVLQNSEQAWIREYAAWLQEMQA